MKGGTKRIAITLVFVGICAALLVVLGKGFGTNPHAVPFMMKGKPAPAFTLKNLETNETVSLEQLRGKPVVLNFWASWCGPCKQEHPYLEWAKREYGDRVVFLGIIFEDTEDNAKAFLRRYGAPFPQLIDPNSLTSVAYAVSGVPETYFISRDGVIIDKHLGPIWPQAMAEKLKVVLSDAAPATAQGARP